MSRSPVSGRRARTNVKSVTDDVGQRVSDTVNPNTQQESTPQAVDASCGQGTDQHFNAQPMYATTPAAAKLRSDASTA